MVVAYPGQQQVAVRILQIAGLGIRKVGKFWNLQRGVGKLACTGIDLAWKEGEVEEDKKTQTQYTGFKGEVAYICARFSPIEQHHATE